MVFIQLWMYKGQIVSYAQWWAEAAYEKGKISYIKQWFEVLFYPDRMKLDDQFSPFVEAKFASSDFEILYFEVAMLSIKFCLGQNDRKIPYQYANQNEESRMFRIWANSNPFQLVSANTSQNVNFDQYVMPTSFFSLLIHGFNKESFIFKIS